MSRQLLLVNLPVEILDYILSILLEEGGIRTIHHISQTCKLFRNMIETSYFMDKLCNLLSFDEHTEAAAEYCQIELPFYGYSNDFFMLRLFSELHRAFSDNADIDVTIENGQYIVTSMDYTIVLSDKNSRMWKDADNWYRSRTKYRYPLTCLAAYETGYTNHIGHIYNDQVYIPANSEDMDLYRLDGVD